MNLGRLAIWAILLGFALPVCASERPGAISGYVRSAEGIPQMGAVVELLGEADRSLTVFTDGAGYYTAAGLLPGFYTLRVTAPSFLPALREKVGVRSGGRVNVNVTLSTLLGVMQLGPVRSVPDDDDWKWTLRSVANRPILRVLDDSSSSRERQNQSHDLTGSVSFVAGSVAQGYGTSSDMSTGFSLQRSMFSDGHLAFAGNVAYGDNVPAGVLRTSYSNRLDDGSEPTASLTLRRFAPADPTNLHNAAMQALALAVGDDFALDNVVELKFGSELQTIQFLGHVAAVRPYVSAHFHLSPNTILAYDYTTSRPDPRMDKGFDTAPADLSESDPRVSMLNFSPQIESAHHQEVSFSRRMGNTDLQLAAFADRIADPALTGVGEVTAAGGFLLPDVASGTFSYTGPNIDTNGVRVVLQRKLAADLTATVDYAFGGALELSQPDVQLEKAQQSIATQRRHSVGAKLSATMPHTHTRWIASYRWVDGPAITPVDMFNASPGRSDPYLNLFIRQPIPCLSGHVEAILDVRNLLAQGYVPVVGQDGETVYLVQSARSVRGGLAFTF